MHAKQQLTFDLHRLDLASEQLWRGSQEILLPGKAFAMLRYMVEHAGQLVSKSELFAALWPGTAVTDGALTFCIVELRKALGDNAKAPRFIETVHRRGYRFLPAITTQPVQGSTFKVLGSDTQDSALRTQHSVLVGRETELAQLDSWLGKALHGERQLVFVTGELGIGKTTLVEAFLSGIGQWGTGNGEQTTKVRQQAKSNRQQRSKDPSPLIPDARPLMPSRWLGRGQCIEQYGSGEPYMPILEALGQLGRGPDGERLIAVLQQHAPTWLVQMSALLSAAEREILQRQTQGATRERMLREMGAAIDALTAERPLVLWLEDLHWSDASTLELLALLARRREPARLLVIGSYRPVDVIVQEHPLRAVKQELQLHGLCAELPLGLLSETQVAEYLDQRFAVGAHGGTLLQPFAKAIHRRTDGNPLFMVTAVEDLIAQKVLVLKAGQWVVQDELTAIETRVPDHLPQLIERQIERLSAEDRRLLEGASVTGMEFSSAAIAAGVEIAPELVEERCEGLARQVHFLRASGTEEWPDGTVAGRYSFLHALYQEVLYIRIPAGRRRRLHQRIGEREEQAYGERAREIAAELAVHFEQGRDYPKAVHYLQQAGENAARRSAHQEAIAHFTTGLQLLRRLPDTPDRLSQEVLLHVTLGSAVSAVKGMAVPEVEQTYVRAAMLCQRGNRPDLLVDVLAGLRTCYLVRGALRKARDVAEQQLQVVQQVASPPALVLAHFGVGEVLSYLGELPTAREHLEHAWRRYSAPDHNSHRPWNWKAIGARVLCCLATTFCVLGYPDQARQQLEQGLALAEEFAHPVTLAYLWGVAGWFAAFHGDWPHVRERAEAALQLATEHGLPHWIAYATGLRGRALVEQGQREEGIALLQQSLASFHSIGSALGRVEHLYWLASAYGQGGRVEEGLAVLAEALAIVHRTGACSSEAELYQLKGALTLRQKSKEQGARSREQEAEACFRKAIAIAQNQHAKLLELRAVMSLVRLWQSQGKKTEAHEILTGIYSWFTEGFDTVDLKEAKALLVELVQH